MKLYSRTSHFIIFLLLICWVESYGSDYKKELFKENCASCHEIGRILTGPDLININSSRTTDWLIAFISDSKKMIEEGDPIANQLYDEYQRIEMPAAGLSKAEILDILDYIENYELVKAVYTPYSEQETNKKKYRFSIIFLLLIVVLIIFLFFLIKTPDLRKRLPTSFYIITALFFGFILSLSASKNKAKNLSAIAAQIKQPVEFSHKVHYTDYQTDCIYCHEKALSYKTANLPPLSNCMKCHDYIREGETHGKDEIAKLLVMDSTQQEINWAKGYRLGEHVHFNHGLHMQSSDLKCTDCHENIENPTITKTTVGMKWCMDCHKKQSVKLSLNYYKNVYDTVYNASGLISSENGSNNCSACHY